MRALLPTLALALAACAHVPEAAHYGPAATAPERNAWDAPLESAAHAHGLEYVLDPRLTAAARAAAEAAARAPAGLALSEDSIRHFVRGSGVADPDVRAHLFDLKDAVPAGLEPWASRQIEPLRNVALVAGGGAQVNRRLCVLIVPRRAEFTTALPRRIAQGRSATMAGRLLTGTGPIELFLASPSGEIRREALGDGPAFSTTIAFDAAGEWRVSIVAGGPSGRLESLQASVDVGGARAVRPEFTRPQRRSKETFEGELLAAVDRFRNDHHAPTLALNPALSASARTLAQRMRSERFLSHVAPDGEDEGRRVKNAGLSLSTLRELFVVARSPDEAMTTLAASAAHLALLSDAAMTQVGVGAAELAASEGESPSWVAVLHLSRPPGRPELEAASKAVLEALNRARTTVNQSPLSVDDRLSSLAQASADAFFREGTAFDDATPRALAKVSESGIEGTSFSGRTVRTSSLDDLPPARQEEARMDHVGIGLAQGSRTDGPRGELVVVLLFADQEGEPVDHDAGVARALEAVNTVRASRKLKPLVRDETLQKRADQLAVRYFDGVATEALVEALHKAPEWLPKNVMTQAAGEASIVEEVAAWDNLLDPKAARVGLGLATGTRPGGRKNGLYLFAIVAGKR